MANNTRVVKKANRFLVLETIKKHEFITVEGIVDRTGLSRPTVLNLLKDLINRNLVEKAGFAQAEVGRQPVLYTMKSDALFAIGIDIDGPPIRIAVSDLKGDLIYSAKWNNDLDDSAEKIVQTIVDHVKKAIQTLNITPAQVIGIALGVPAAVDIKKNISIDMSRLKAIKDQPIAQAIEEKTGIKVVVRNDAALLALAEKDFIECDDLLYFVHRTGIGMSIIIDGQMYEGNTGNAGYIGHMTLEAKGRPCTCGLNGCLEALSSKRAIEEIYSETNGKKLSYLEILNAADHGNKDAIHVCKTAGEYLGIAIANTIKAFDIYTIVIGDTMCQPKHVFIKSTVSAVKECLAHHFKKHARVLLGELKENEYGLGGCKFVINEFFASPELVLKSEQDT